MVKSKTNKSILLFDINEIGDFLGDTSLLKSFVENVDRWLKKKAIYIDETLRDVEITLENLMAAFQDLSLLGLPMHKYVLSQWILDCKAPTLDVNVIKNIIWSNYKRIFNEIEGYVPEPSDSDSVSSEVHLLEMKPLWVFLSLKYITVESSVPCLNFNELFPVTTTILQLKYFIRKRLGEMPVLAVTLYSQRSRKIENSFHESSRISDIGIEGGPKGIPEEALLFYDVSLQIFDCPLLSRRTSHLRRMRTADLWLRKVRAHYLASTTSTMSSNPSASDCWPPPGVPPQTDWRFLSR